MTYSAAASRVLQFITLLILLAGTLAHSQVQSPRQIIAQATVEEDEEKKAALISSLIGRGDDSIRALLTAWKETRSSSSSGRRSKIPVTLSAEKDAEGAQAALRVDDGKPLLDKDGKPLRLVAADLDAAEHDSNLRT